MLTCLLKEDTFLQYRLRGDFVNIKKDVFIRHIMLEAARMKNLCQYKLKCCDWENWIKWDR